MRLCLGTPPGPRKSKLRIGCRGTMTFSNSLSTAEGTYHLDPQSSYSSRCSTRMPPRTLSCITSRALSPQFRTCIQCPRITQHFHISPRWQTDGVFKELTEMRVRTPWIEALRKKEEEGIDPTRRSDTPATPSNRDLTPKRMSDSYHRVVWLL